MIKKIGKIGKLNRKENSKLKQLWIDKDIRWCEFDEVHVCNFGLFPENAHRHKKTWYRGKPDELRWSFNQVAKICNFSHNYIEFNAKRTVAFFKRLRGPEIAY